MTTRLDNRISRVISLITTYEALLDANTGEGSSKSITVPTSRGMERWDLDMLRKTVDDLNRELDFLYGMKSGVDIYQQRKQIWV